MAKIFTFILMLSSLSAFGEGNNKVWEKIIDCNNEQMVIDRSCSESDKFHCDYQLVIRNGEAIRELVANFMSYPKEMIYSVQPGPWGGDFESIDIRYIHHVLGKNLIEASIEGKGIRVKGLYAYYGYPYVIGNWYFNSCKYLGRN